MSSTDNSVTRFFGRSSQPAEIGCKLPLYVQDLALIKVLADFAAMAVRHRRQQQALLQQTKAAAAAAMANHLAHEINNPLQSLTNLVYLASEHEPVP